MCRVFLVVFFIFDSNLRVCSFRPCPCVIASSGICAGAAGLAAAGVVAGFSSGVVVAAAAGVVAGVVAASGICAGAAGVVVVRKERPSLAPVTS